MTTATPPAGPWDVIVVGAGHNGLAAAARLAKARRRVLVVERRGRPGGLAAGEVFHPGYTAPGLLHDTALLDPAVADGLELESHGLEWREPAPVWIPDGGEGLLLSRRPGARGEVAGVSEDDVRAYVGWRGFLDTVAPPLRRLLAHPPPPLESDGLRDLLSAAVDGLALRRLGGKALAELLRVLPMCAADWLGERFTSPLLAAALTAPAVGGTFLGPWSAGSAANLLFHEVRRGHSVDGGPAAVVAALVRAAEAHGAEILLGVEVAEIRVEDGRIAGVRLEDGVELDAPTVLASCDPKRTFLRLLPPEALEVRVERALAGYRVRGTTAAVRLALDRPLELAARPDLRPQSLLLGFETVDDIERAFDHAKYRQLGKALLLEVAVPTASAAGLAPEGHEVVTVLASFVPHDLDGGWTDDARERLGDRVVEILADHAPGVRAGLVGREVLTPVDLETRYGLTGGQIHHGEPALDQLLFMRPAPFASRYATPIPGLWLGGSGSHPGGGITCTPGWLAAGRVLRFT